MIVIEELGERVARVMAEENIGTHYHRIQSIKMRMLYGHMDQALNPLPRCSFTNQYGYCLEPVGHIGKHRCVFLGDD